MAKHDMLVVLLQLPLIVLLLHWNAASATTVTDSAAVSVTPRGRRSLDSSQLKAGREFWVRGHTSAPTPGVRVHTPVPAPGVRVYAPAPAPGPSRTHSVNSERDTQMSPDHPPLSPSPSPSPPPPPPPSPPPPPQEPTVTHVAIIPTLLESGSVFALYFLFQSTCYMFDIPQCRPAKLC